MFYLLVVYTFFAIVRPQDYPIVHNTFPIMRILFYLLIIGFVFIREKGINYKADLFLLLFFIAGILSFVSHLYLGGIVNFIFSFLPTVLLYLLITKVINSQDKILKYLKYIIVFAAILALHGILQFYNNGIGWSGQTFTEGTTRIRYVGIFSDPNDLSLFFNMVIPFTIYFYKKADKITYKLLNIILLAGFLYAVYLTQSRGALVGLYVMLNYFIWKNYGIKNVVLINIVVLPILFGLKGRMTDIDAEEDSAYGRIEAWYEGFQMLKQYPLFGVGPGMFTDYHFRTAHNSFVLALSETGLIGYFFWIGCLYYSFIDLKNNIVSNFDSSEEVILDLYLQLSLIGFLTSAFFLSRTYVLILYILLGLITARARTLEKDGEHFMDSNFKPIDLLKIFGAMSASIVFIMIMYKVSL